LPATHMPALGLSRVGFQAVVKERINAVVLVIARLMTISGRDNDGQQHQC
jgi:hypothetical protein